MKIRLYNNSSPKKKLHKDLSLVDTLTGSLKERCDLINPSIMIEGSTVPSGNYAYIPEFGRYYYITKVTSERATLWRLDMHVDVYMSYETAIRQNTPIYERSQYLFNMYLPDNEMPIEDDTFTVTKKIGGFDGFAFLHPNVILIVQG